MAESKIKRTTGFLDMLDVNLGNKTISGSYYYQELGIDVSRQNYRLVVPLFVTANHVWTKVEVQVAKNGENKILITILTQDRQTPSSPITDGYTFYGLYERI